MHQKLHEILISGNQTNYGENNIGNTNMEEVKKEGLAGGSSGTKCHLSKIEKLAVLSRVAQLKKN